MILCQTFLFDSKMTLINTDAILCG